MRHRAAVIPAERALCEREPESSILRGLFFTTKGYPPHGPSHTRAFDRRSASTEKTTMIVAAFAPSVCGVASIDSERVANHKACAGAAKPKDGRGDSFPLSKRRAILPN